MPMQNKSDRKNTDILMKPEEIVIRYYELLYGGSIGKLKELMVSSSYRMTLEAFGLRLSLKNPVFKSLLEKIEEDDRTLKKVEELLCAELASRKISPEIQIVEVEMNGEKRMTVHFTENKKEKKLYFSKKNEVWKIDYYAGRRIS